MAQALDRRADITNAALAAELGVKHVHISHLRSGRRHPSLELIVEIDDLLPEFDINMQVHAILAGTFATAFEEALGERYGWRSVVR